MDPPPDGLCIRLGDRSWVHQAAIFMEGIVRTFTSPPFRPFSIPCCMSAV
jgi:hypothetical protein